MKPIPNIIEYWRRSLRDAERMALSGEKLASAPRVPLQELVTGRVSSEVAASITQGQSGSGRTSGQGSRQMPGVEVVICPLIARRRGYRGGKPGDLKDAITPLWVPAVLGPGGELAPSPSALPWIARNVLEPMDRDSVILASVDDLERFLASHPPLTDESRWPDVWSYARTMLERVTGMTLEQFQIADYEVDRSSAYLLVADAVQGSGSNILSLYDAILHSRTFPPLLTRYASTQPAALRPLLAGSSAWEAAALHTGQMRSKYAISPSQREALHHSLAMSDGEILAVNGPPGTGKTTLIQSVVATLWVNAALCGGEPPVILAASTNNQAVTNIIESFAMSEADEFTVRRWVPHVKSFGLYCVSQYRSADALAKGYQIELYDSDRKRSEFFATLESQVYHQAAVSAFLQHCTAFFGRHIPDLEQASELLRAELTSTVSQIKSGVTAWEALRVAQRLVLDRYSEHGGVETFIATLRHEFTDAQDERTRLQALRDRWQGERARLRWPWPFHLLPAGRQHEDRGNRAFFAAASHPIDLPLLTHRAVAAYLQTLGAARAAAVDEVIAAITQAGEDLQRLQQYRAAWAGWCAANRLSPDVLDPLERMDMTLRFHAFELATHYWEARWLLEVRQRLASRPEAPGLRSTQEQRWRRYAKLTPCLVSTLHMAPRFFSAWENRQPAPLYAFIDLLIIDEAGQVSPDVAGATFALARKALVVGDVEQIEPVWTVTGPVDEGNLRRSKVAETVAELEAFARTDKSAASGSVMRVAQAACAYQTYAAERGLFLSEHRRCVPEIIAYCNQLAYGGRLESKRGPKADRILPAMGYAHIAGVARRIQGSWENPREAEVIAAWVADHRLSLEAHYPGLQLSKIVGVVTPFVRQAQRIKGALRQQRVNDLTVGTVHTLQGAERPVIIFSSVYDQPGPFFFDRAPNMLNVAVSRAKDSFLVFGNMPIFEPNPPSHAHRGRPSSLLARHLFASPSNELPISARWLEDLPRQVRTRLLPTLNDHRQTLADALRYAKRRVLIVSPQLSERAIRDDRIEHLIAEAVQRNVSVEIYTDHQLDVADETTGALKPAAEAARHILPRAGAKLHVINRIHNKTLCVDDTMIVIGSFNWLSASRDETYRYQRHEESLRCEGPGAEELIAQVTAEMERRLQAQALAGA